MKQKSAWLRSIMNNGQKTYAVTANNRLIIVDGVFESTGDLIKALTDSPPGSQYYSPRPPRYKLIDLLRARDES